MMFQIRRVALGLLILGLLPGAAVLGGTRDPSATPIPIAVARDLSIGKTVTVKGIVSTPPGAFRSSFSDQGFGLQDDSAGLYVSAAFKTLLKEGDGALVTGILAESAGLRTLIPIGPKAIHKLTAADHEPLEAIRALPVLTGAVGNSNQGRIVRVRGTANGGLTADLPYGYEFHVDDGSGSVRIFINLDVQMDASHLDPTASSQLCVTGFSSAYNTPEIDIRSPADLRCH